MEENTQNDLPPEPQPVEKPAESASANKPQKKQKSPKVRAWQAKFLANIRVCGHPSKAADECGISLHHVYECRHNDPEFAAAWEEALNDAVEHIELCAMKRSAEHSDGMARFMLSGRKRKVYGHHDGDLEAPEIPEPEIAPDDQEKDGPSK